MTPATSGLAFVLVVSIFVGGARSAVNTSTSADTRSAWDLNAPTCMTRSLRKAGIHSLLINDYSKALLRDRIDEQVLSCLDYKAADSALRSAGIAWADRQRIFKCFNTDKQNSLGRPCAATVCQNGGSCSIDVEANTYYCQCLSNYHGSYCEKRLSNNAELTLFRNDLATIKAAVGTTFTRWGHDECPYTSQLMYSGFMAGSFYTHAGGGANHLCLPFDPIYVPDVGNSGGAHIYGAEYEAANNLNAGKKNIQDRSIPCSVCKAQRRGAALMIPARNECPPNWVREYHGFIMAAHHGHQKGDYICMDREMNVLPGHEGDQNGDLLYSVSVGCSQGFDCPPYQADKPITCAVCTQ